MDSRCAIMGTCKSTPLDKGNRNADRRLIVKYTKEERLDIGRRIYTGEMSRYEASEKYDINIKIICGCTVTPMTFPQNGEHRKTMQWGRLPHQPPVWKNSNP